MAIETIEQFIEEYTQGGFLEHAPSVLEDRFEPVNQDHIKRQKETNKYLAMIRNKVSPLFEENWTIHYDIKRWFNDVLFTKGHLINNISLDNFTYKMARIDMEVKELTKSLKKARKQDSVLDEYYSNFDHLLNANFFNMFAVAVKEQYDSMVEHSYRLSGVNSTNVIDRTLEEVLSSYKSALKQAKQDIAEEKRKPT